MSADLETAIARLERLKERLSDTADFYESHKDGWETLAKVTVSQYLSAHMPQDADPEKWTQLIGDIVARVVAAVFEDGETTGLVLFLSTDGTQPQGGGYKAVVDYETVLRWVRAGRAGDPKGKHIKDSVGQVDAGKTDGAIAWRVFHALRRKSGANIDRMRQAIEEFAVEGGLLNLDDFIAAILPVWFEVFTVRAGEDWTEWVERMTAGLG